VFITMSSFMNYTLAETLNQYTVRGYNISVFSGSDPNVLVQYSDDIVNLLGPEDTYMLVRQLSVFIDDKYVNEGWAEQIGAVGDVDFFIDVIAIGSSNFREYVESFGLTYEERREKGFHVIASHSDWPDMYNIVDSIELQGQKETLDLTIARRVNESQLNRRGRDYIIVSDETFDRLSDEAFNSHMTINSVNPDVLEDEIRGLNSNFWVNNYEARQTESRRIVLIVSIFLYGFISVIITIGLTNIINTLTTSLNLRKKEFAMLKAVGMTSKEFKQMINLESIFLGTKVLLIGIPIGMFFSYLIYYFIAKIDGTETAYDPNISAILISVVAVFVIVKIIMSYSMRQINKQNIIETIRNDNI
ncbi:MAG: FtsX-like permease family protein, partial [Oscillospiraceae bacterium]|nr:FtsX-like permease family protein [Oscillospiraceae bacterium]